MLLASEDYSVIRGVLVPVAVVKDVRRLRAHVNGYIVMMNAALLDHPDATDITDLLKGVPGSH